MGGKVTVGDHYYDPEHERVLEYQGNALQGPEDFYEPLMMLFRDLMTDEVISAFEFEIAEPWTFMNEMEVIAWASK